MRVRKLIKVTGIVVLVLAILGLGAIATFLFNPFEGSVNVLPDVVPRRIDFFLRKVDLRSDFDGTNESFPEPPAIRDMRDRDAWQEVAEGPAWASLRSAGIERAVAEARKAYKELSKNWVDLVDDVLGREVQISGRIDPSTQSLSWCLYTRVSMRIRAGYGLLGYSSMQESLRNGGTQVERDGEFYRLRPQGSDDLYLVRHLDCVMVANDRSLLDESYQLAKGSAKEPFGTSSPFQDNIIKPIRAWERRAGAKANTLQFYLHPRQLIRMSPAWGRWPNPKAPDNRNERILASFFNPESWRFLSGSLVFETELLAVLADLVVDNTKHTRFQKEFFKAEREGRGKWMDEFFAMVPRSACAGIALRMPAGQFLKEMNRQGLEADERSGLDELLQGTGRYKGVPDLIDKIQVGFRPRVGIVFSRNQRSKDSKEKFPVQEDSGWPQWAWVFWLNEVGEKPIQNFVQALYDHRTTFGWTAAYELGLTGLGKKDVAWEFGQSLIPGTGELAVCTYRRLFIVSNYGPLINRMVNTRLRSENIPLHRTPAFTPFQEDTWDSMNGLAYINGEQWNKVFQDMLKQARESQAAIPDTAWAIEKRPVAERIVFQRSYKHYGEVERIPPLQKTKFSKEVDAEVDAMWAQQREQFGVKEQAWLRQAVALTKALRSAFLQVALEPNSLRLAGRILTSDY